MKGDSTTAKPYHVPSTVSTVRSSVITESSAGERISWSSKPNETQKGGGNSSETKESSSKSSEIKVDAGLVTLIGGAFLAGVGIATAGGVICVILGRKKSKKKCRRLAEQTSKDIGDVKEALISNRREMVTHLNSMRHESLGHKREIKNQIRMSSQGLERKRMRATIEQGEEMEMKMMGSTNNIVKERMTADERRKNLRAELDEEAFKKAHVEENAKRGIFPCFQYVRTKDYQYGGAVPSVAEELGVDPDAFEESDSFLEGVENVNE